MVKQLNKTDWELVLESLDGLIVCRDDRYWYKLHFLPIAVSPQYPHGLKYELTLHDPSNKRIFGYDNAHSVSGDKRFSGRRIEYDHLHKTQTDKGTPYDFEDLDKLLADFYSGIDIAIETHKNRRKTR